MSRILVFPAWRTNPYLTMLYSEARAQGWRASGHIWFGPTLADLAALSSGDAFHLHWTAPIADVPDEEEFAHRIDRLDAALAEAHDRGVRILWTVHNLMTHDSRYVEQEIRLATVLAARADTILVLNSKTADVAAPFYTIPEHKIVHLQHSSYQGVYPAPLGRDAARAATGIPVTADVVGFTGAIRPYKGVDSLLAAAERLAGRNPHTAIALAGGANAREIEQLERILPRHVPVYRQYGVLTDAEIAAWTEASDVLVLAYEAILNSGSMMLAATLGVPVVLPGLDHLRADFGDEAWIEFFDPSVDDKAGAIADAIERVLATRAEKSAAARSFARTHLPRRMAVDFLGILGV
ncbi:glycosyltransferase [Brevibacterium samyangense]|uniref:Glycosyltransferase n=1 Tax=Brevibacterium samyangense TaxID=366888 RepID=A0ABN2TNM7_9MICO